LEGQELPRRSLYVSYAHVDLAALEGGQPGRLVGDDAEDEPLDGWRFAPVSLVGLQHQLHPRLEGHEPVGSRPHRGFLETVLADFLHVFLGHDPGRAGGRSGEERHEVEPGFLEAEAHLVRIDDFHRGDPVPEELGGGAAVALEREFDVVSRHGVAVVERDALAQHELVHEAVLGDQPRLGQALALRSAGYELHEGVVHRVERHERSDQARRLRRIEPRGGQRDVDGPRELTRRCRGGRAGGDDGEQREGQEDDGDADAMDRT